MDDEREYLNELEPDEGWLDEPEELKEPDEAEPPEETGEPCGDDESEEQIKPSEVFEGLLDYLEFAKKEYESNAQEVWRHDRNLQDDVHAFELAQTDEDARELGVIFRHKRQDRRVCKDTQQLYEESAKFYADKNNKPFFDKIRSLIKRQERQEEYLSGERHYNRRGDDGGN